MVKSKFLYKTIAIITALALCVTMVPAAALPKLNAFAAEGNVKYVKTADEFMNALNNATAGDIIDLQNNEITTPQLADDCPLVNKAEVTIQNAKISVSHAGIVLGAKLTLKNVQLTFRNTVRNGIFANGHSLELENVTRLGGNDLNIHVVCGQIINSANENNKADSYIPTRGYNQQVTIKGTNDLGKIILGQFDDSPSGEASKASWYYSGTNLTIDSSCTKVSETAANRVIYACGAYEPRGEGKGDEITPVSNKYCVSSMSQYINLYGSTINTVYGETGANNKTVVNYYGSDNLTDSVTLDTIRAFYVKSGAFKIKSSYGSSILAGAQQELGVDSGATLIAGALGDTTVYKFSGGGTLSLGTKDNLRQNLKVTNSVSGTTNVVFGDTMNFFHLNTPIADYVYINAPSSGANAFTSLNGPAGTVWTRNTDGGWLWSTSGETKHEHDYEWKSISDIQHALVCKDAGCTDENKGQWNEQNHDYDSESDRICPTCGYERIIVKDIFTPKDSSKYEQFKAKLYNSLLQCETNIDVTDIKIKPEEIVYTSNNGQTFDSGLTSINCMIRFHSLFSTLCTTGQPSIDLNTDGTIKRVYVTYSNYTWSRKIVSEFEEQYENAMNAVSGLNDDFQIALTLHEWICDHVNYGLSAQYADFALGAIKNGAAVCAGYSYAYQFLAEQAGLECKYVAGNTVNLLSDKKETIAHAWNKVKINGYWFWLDTTWDGSQTTTGHSFCLLNDSEWRSAGSGGHANDEITQTNEPPANTNAHFANKFWEGKTGVLTAEEISQDPQLTVDCEHNNKTTEVNKKDATCTSKGYTGDTVCNECKKVLEQGHETDMLEHTWNDSEVTTQPGCATKGVKTFTCTTCSTTRTEEIEAKGHSWDEGVVTTEATCQKTGVKTFTCSNCKATSTEEIAADPDAHHIVEVAGQEATCLGSGWKAYSYCDNDGCNHGTEKEIINPLGHEYGEDGKCIRCSHEKSAEPCSHATTVIEKTKDATCTEDGSHDVFCTDCGEYTERNVVDKALGHSYVVAGDKVEATCGTSGHEAGEDCERCGDHHDGAEIPATGKHNYVKGACTVCAAKDASYVETFKVNITKPAGSNVTFNKTSYKPGETAKLTIKGQSVGNNIQVVKSVKVNGVVYKTQSQLLNKSTWQQSNSVYKRKMNEDVSSVEYASVIDGLQSGAAVDIKNITPTTKVEVEFEELVPVYRLYNQITSEHLFTTDKGEYDEWVSKSKTDTDFWIGEGINWFAPKTGTSTVTRLYNPTLGALGRTSHYYTSDESEIKELTTKHGWVDESRDGKTFASGGDIPIWTCYNEALGSAHHYTSSESEWKNLSNHGWDLEKSKNRSSGVFKAAMSAIS